ncbi:MAG: FAD:protein FMN transferase [Desulfuromonadales bacterium]|nr:FAD:protein FMN transferase [Desulfuromonadales bacterium]
MLRSRPFILVLLALVLAGTWWRLQPEPGQLREVRLLLGTTIEIVAEHPDADRLEDAVAAAFDEIQRLEWLMDPQRPDSDVARLSATEKSLKVAPETARVVELGLDVARRSDGAFDLSLGRLKALWGLDGSTPQVPGAQEIAAALQGIGPEALQLEGLEILKSDPGLSIDLGGVAKGFAVDRAVAVLGEHGVTSAAVNAGGDMYLLGSRGKRPWRIGIQHPRKSGAVLTSVEASNLAVVTSGDYERFFEQDGRRYHHLFDPQSGYPADACQSVTVLADSVALADALATALFVLGPERGLELLSAYAGVEALIIAGDGRMHPSSGWKTFVPSDDSGS